MSNFIISLGIINKKLLIPIIYIIIYFFVHFINQNAEYNEVYVFLDGFGYSLGELSSFFVAQFLKYRRIGSKKRKKTLVKQYFKDFSNLLLILSFYMIMKLIPFYVILYYFVSDEENDEKDKYKNLFLNDSLEVVCVTIVVIISIIIDLILGNFNHLITSLVISSIFYVIGDSFMSTYDKILMEKKYYHFMDV